MLDKTTSPLSDTALDSAACAEDAGLRFVGDDEPGISRSRPRKLFRYTWPSGEMVRDQAVMKRILSLAIPPAWTDVWVCRDANGHIQATGRDARGRKQYRYHPDWHRVRDEAKYESLIDFGRNLPCLRTTIQEHMAERGLGQQRVLATVVHLLDTTLIRVGNREYARANNSFGLTTLQDRHVSFDGSDVKFRFRGKTGKEWRLKVSDRRIARIVRCCQDLPGQHLFQYEDDEGSVRPVTSADVNDYLREVAGPTVSAKMFRTWAGTVLASVALREFGKVDSEAHAKRNIRSAIEAVAIRLGNTATICRKCYVHPEVINAYLEGSLLKTLARKVKSELKRELADLPPEEAAVLAFLHARLRRT
ncbi:MAG TPA: DNA topoisomerase IB [Hyphomicrobium sp.]|nr:DNA topoisomerase IB [Hyphomicrobium sp.]